MFINSYRNFRGKKIYKFLERCNFRKETKNKTYIICKCCIVRFAVEKSYWVQTLFIHEITN